MAAFPDSVIVWLPRRIFAAHSSEGPLYAKLNYDSDFVLFVFYRVKTHGVVRVKVAVVKGTW